MPGVQQKNGFSIKMNGFAKDLFNFAQKFIIFNMKNWFNTRMPGVPTEKMYLALKWLA